MEGHNNHDTLTTILIIYEKGNVQKRLVNAVENNKFVKVHNELLILKCSYNPSSSSVNIRTLMKLGFTPI